MVPMLDCRTHTCPSSERLARAHAQLLPRPTNRQAQKVNGPLEGSPKSPVARVPALRADPNHPRPAIISARHPNGPPWITPQTPQARNSPSPTHGWPTGHNVQEPQVRTHARNKPSRPAPPVVQPAFSPRFLKSKPALAHKGGRPVSLRPTHLPAPKRGWSTGYAARGSTGPRSPKPEAVAARPSLSPIPFRPARHSTGSQYGPQPEESNTFKACAQRCPTHSRPTCPRASFPRGPRPASSQSLEARRKTCSTSPRPATTLAPIGYGPQVLRVQHA